MQATLKSSDDQHLLALDTNHDGTVDRTQAPTSVEDGGTPPSGSPPTNTLVLVGGRGLLGLLLLLILVGRLRFRRKARVY